LIWYAAAWHISKPEEIHKIDINAGLTEADLPTDSFQCIYREFAGAFCASVDTKGLAKALARQSIPLRRERLTTLLFVLHSNALDHLFRVLKKHNLSPIEMPSRRCTASPAKLVVKLWAALVRKPPTSSMSVESVMELLGRSVNHVNRQLELDMLRQVDRKDEALKIIALFSRFPEMYVQAFLRDLHFTPWRVACFSRRCVNASMWGTYGDGHRGAVLVYRTTERDNRRFFAINGLHASRGREALLEVQPVVYRRQPPLLDSFLEIGNLPIPKLASTWMRSPSGETSTRYADMASDIDTWRKAHWQKHNERAIWKHPDWEHEAESRLVASTAFSDDPAPEPLTYNFSQLEGIVFGMRMSVDDKLRIQEIVEKKCRAEGRTDFRFFGIRYSPEKGEMELEELGLLGSK